LAVLIIVAAISLFCLPALRRHRNVRKSEFVLAAICILGVGLVGVLEGII
jgi:MFS superfamily sulfate permease-like transporter